MGHSIKLNAMFPGMLVPVDQLRDGASQDVVTWADSLKFQEHVSLVRAILTPPGEDERYKK